MAPCPPSTRRPLLSRAPKHGAAVGNGYLYIAPGAPPVGTTFHVLAPSKHHDLPMGSFIEGYRKVIGGTKSTPQLYLGFALFFSGAALGISALTILAASDAVIQDAASRRELAGILAGIGFPLTFFGLQLTLPARLLIQIVAGVGAAIMLFATWLFASLYPEQWNQVTVDRSSEVVSWLVVGVAILVTTVALSLVLNYVSRFVALPGQEQVDIYADRDREPTMEEILADIEREVSRQGLTWGGMSDAQLATQMVKIRADFGDDAVINPTGKAGTVTTFSDTPDEAAYHALLKMRGRERGHMHEDDETGAAIATLRALRQKAIQEQERSWWYRFKRWLVGLFTGGRPPTRTPPASERNKDKTHQATQSKSPPSSSLGGSDATEDGRTGSGPGKTPRKRTT